MVAVPLDATQQSLSHTVGKTGIAKTGGLINVLTIKTIYRNITLLIDPTSAPAQNGVIHPREWRRFSL